MEDTFGADVKFASFTEVCDAHHRYNLNVRDGIFFKRREPFVRFANFIFLKRKIGCTKGPRPHSSISQTPTAPPLPKPNNPSTLVAWLHICRSEKFTVEKFDYLCISDWLHRTPIDLLFAFYPTTSRYLYEVRVKSNLENMKKCLVDETCWGQILRQGFVPVSQPSVPDPQVQQRPN